MSEVKIVNKILHKERVIGEAPFARFLFNNPKAALLWLPLRIWLGYQWIEASLHKIGNPAWVQTGDALKGFWMGAVTIPDSGRPAIAFDWYRSFIQFMLDAQAYTWFAKLVAYGEFIIGLSLILGLFTGIAAFFGGFMNWNFIMAGSASINGMLFAVSVGLILAWKIGGLIGVDYFLLPVIGAPWGRQKPVENGASPALQPVPSGDK